MISLLTWGSALCHQAAWLLSCLCPLPDPGGVFWVHLGQWVGCNILKDGMDMLAANVHWKSSTTLPNSCLEYWDCTALNKSCALSSLQRITHFTVLSFKADLFSFSLKKLLLFNVLEFPVCQNVQDQSVAETPGLVVEFRSRLPHNMQVAFYQKCVLGTIKFLRECVIPL